MFNKAIAILRTLLFSIKQEELTIRPLLKKIIKNEKNVKFSISPEKVARFVKIFFEDYPSPNYSSYSFLFNDG